MSIKINYVKVFLLNFIFLLFYLKYQYLPFALISYFLITLVSIWQNDKKIKTLVIVLPIIILFFLGAISLLFSINISFGLETIQTQLSLLLFPLFVLFDRDFFRDNIRIIINSYLFITFLSLIVLMVLFILKGGIQSYLKFADKESFFSLMRYLKLTGGQHPTYISLGYLFSVILIWSSLKEAKTYFLLMIKLFYLISVIAFILLLNSRAILIALFLVVIYYALKQVHERKNIYKVFVIAGLIAVFVVFANNTRFRQVFYNFKNASSIEQIDLRFSLWRNAIIAWKQAPVFGHGIGDGKEALIKVHKQRNIEEAVEYNYNAHNQFLESAIQTGLIGIIVLLLVFLIPLYHSIKKKQEILFLFLLITIICFVFESMLQRLTGVVFFSFWYSFLLLVYYPKEEIVPIPIQPLQ